MTPLPSLKNCIISNELSELTREFSDSLYPSGLPMVISDRYKLSDRAMADSDRFTFLGSNKLWLAFPQCIYSPLINRRLGPSNEVVKVYTLRIFNLAGKRECIESLIGRFGLFIHQFLVLNLLFERVSKG